MTPSRSRAGGGSDGLLAQLLELRARLLKAILSVLLVLIVLLPFSRHLYDWLAQPLIQSLPGGSHMIAIEVASTFLTPLKLAFVVALFVAMPAVLYQIWAFVGPGLYRHERSLAIPLLASAVLLFYIGCAFAYFVVLPAAFHFFASDTPTGVSMMTDIGKYLDFVLTMFFAFGLCFEVPVAVVLLAALGIVTPARLKAMRRYVIVGIFVVAAVLAPPDLLSMILLAVPMMVLYEIGVFASVALVRGRLLRHSVSS